MGRINNIKQANLFYDAQSHSVARWRQQIIFNVSQQYLQILLDEELVKIAHDNMEVQNTTLDQIKTFVELGTRTITDEYNQEAAARQSEVLKLRAEFDYRNDKALLVQTLQLEPGEDIKVVQPSWGIESILQQDYNVSDLYQVALENRPDHKQFESLEQANKRGIQAATAGYYPVIGAFFNCSIEFIGT